MAHNISANVHQIRSQFHQGVDHAFSGGWQKHLIFQRITQSTTFAKIFKDFGLLTTFHHIFCVHSTPFASSIQRTTRSVLCSPWYTFFVVLCCANIQIYMIGSYTWCTEHKSAFLHSAVFEPTVRNNECITYKRHADDYWPQHLSSDFIISFFSRLVFRFFSCQ